MSQAAEESTYSTFSYATAPNAALYRRIMLAFVRAKERFTVHLRPEDVQAALLDDGGAPVPQEQLAVALDSLASGAWGNLLAFPDSSRVTAIEDFYRRRMLYQLSRPGEAAERALRHYDESFGSRGALQAVALEDIAILLRSLHDALAGERSESDALDDHRIHQDLRSLRERFSELADNAVVFMGSVQRSIDLQDANLEAFLAYKDRLISYLERFIADLVTRAAQISALLGEFTGDDVRLICEIAVRREAQDTAPGELVPVSPQQDGAGTTPRDTSGPAEELLLAWLRRWQGLSDWFVSTSARDSEAKLLRARARSAIPALLAVVASLHDRHSGRSDRSADFLTLARWFSELPDDASRHRLWRTSFGLTSTRHLTVTPETEDAWERDRVGPSTPWALAWPVEVSPQLRRTGSYERRGRPHRVTDRAQAKAMLAVRMREESEQTAAARRRILTGGPVPLSAFTELDTEAFRLFLALLGDGVAALRPGVETAQVDTSDGGLRLVIARLPDAPEATLRTLDGTLTGPDHLVDITLVGVAET
ncbi:TIGR02677 family protein [Occultella kanbiaonis]|uniref:TIGR02677 family protein n=1 Tax=Occultella kanbiaonis TaxID=2675754 RepID=UPI001A988026|nr:TIGR02677 family protein [Occultella kanbiaonis]